MIKASDRLDHSDHSERTVFTTMIEYILLFSSLHFLSVCLLFGDVQVCQLQVKC